MTVEADFTVVGKNYWEIDREALRVIESLVGDLYDQRAEYSVRCQPKLGVFGDQVPVMWEGDVHVEIYDIPPTVDYNTKGNR